MKPIVKRLKLRGKVRSEDLEQAVLKTLNDTEEEFSSEESIVHNSKEEFDKRSPAAKKQDTRFEHLATPTPARPAQNNGNSDEGVISAGSPPKSQESRLIKDESSPSKDSDGVPEKATAAPVLVYSPETHKKMSPTQSPSSFYTPGSTRTVRTTVASTISIRRGRPESPESPTPRPRHLEAIDLESDNIVPLISQSSPTFKLKPSVFKHLDPTQQTLEPVPSSPPPLANSILPSVIQSSPKSQAELGSPFLTSSRFEESDPAPFRPPIKAAASSVQKSARLSSSRRSNKRPRLGSSSRGGRLIVEGTPEHKLSAPMLSSAVREHMSALPTISSSAYGSSNLMSDQPASPSFSPLAHKSRKRNHFEYSTTKRFDSQETESLGINSEADYPVEDEVDPMDLDSVTNRSLGVLNDNSPVISRQLSLTPLLPEESERDTEDELQGALRSADLRESTPYSVEGGIKHIDHLLNKMAVKYDLDAGEIERDTMFQL
ncbi:hypothetical protein ABW20_dc0103142 [Dactylellina cionopaga]|nr:hypothetical protein ABW20_dc0103142 [Dactylellina cionopaga]